MPKRVLAIEDDPQIAELLNLLLQSPEIEVIQRTNGREGLEAALQEKPDMILLDVMIPELSGWEVYDAVRKNDDTKSVPIIVISVAQPEAERRHVFAASKIDFYYSKPFDVLTLRRTIRDILGNVESWGVGDSPPPPRPNTSKLRPITEKLREERITNAKPRTGRLVPGTRIFRKPDTDG